MIEKKIINYEIKSVLGEGGMAKVYLAEHNIQHNSVAIKVLNEEFLEDKNIRKRFIEEAKSLANLDHKNIIKVIDTYNEDNFVAFVMEYIEGPTLNEIIQQGKLADNYIQDYMKQLLAAVEYIHSNGITHRDIKPSNILIGKHGILKLVDFGIAKHAKNPDGTSTMFIMGTPSYMSPEQIRNSGTVTSQTDIYSIGVVLWEMVSGKRLYNTLQLTTPEIQTQILNQELPLTKTKWDSVIAKATKKSIVDRYKNCDEMERNIFDKTLIDENPLGGSTIIKKKSKVGKFLLSFLLVSIVLLFAHYTLYPELYKINDPKGIPETLSNNIIVDADGNAYEIIEIGRQNWVSSNFNCSRFKNGDEIPEAKTDEEWAEASSKGLPAWCYNKTRISDEKYGKLYNWYAVNDARGLAPYGFRVASKEDWNILHEYIGKNSTSAMKIKTGYWNSGEVGKDEIGFNALAAGFRTETYTFSSIGQTARWWTNSDYSIDEAVGYAISESELKTFNYKKSLGFSVRLIKDNQIFVYKIGQKRLGGIIFSITPDGKHGLVCSETDLGSFNWDSANKSCLNLSMSGYNDWYLPSKKELKRLYIRRSIINNFSDKLYYWSSDSFDIDRAFWKSFNSGEMCSNLKSEIGLVRAIRAF